jgi:hypothetical protein
MAKEKAENTAIRLKPSEKLYLEKRAAELGMTLSDLLRAGARLYAGFERDFLEAVWTKSGEAGVEPAIVVQQLLQTYIATEAAILKVLGGQSKTWVRAFQKDIAGLVSGDRLNRIVFDQVQAEAMDLRKKLVGSARTGVATKITKEEAALLAARV